MPNWTSSSASDWPNQLANLAAAGPAPESSTGPGGINARMRTSGVSVPASRTKSRSARAATNAVPSSVAEDRCTVVTDPLPEGGCAPDLGVVEEFVFGELACVEAVRADEQATTGLGELGR